MITDDDIRKGLHLYADTIQSTPPPIDTITSNEVLTIGTRHRVSRAVLISVGCAGVVVAAGAVAATGLFSNHTAEFVKTVCGLDVSDAHVVATDTDTAGNLAELSVISGPRGDGTIMKLTDPNGELSYEATGCGPEPGGMQNPAGRPWASSPSLKLDGHDTLIQVNGWIPEPAAVAVVTFTDGRTESIEAGDDGYFLRLITTEPDSATDIAHVAALTDDGALVAEGDPTG